MIRPAMMASSALALALALPSPLWAQDSGDDLVAADDQQPADDEFDDEELTEIVVRAGSLLGSLDVDEQPVLELDEADIAAYGAGSVAELLQAISPATTSGRGGRGGGGQPVILVNGQRINGFRELGRYPPEAISKVEVLPEEVAVRFGFRPDQRVVNFVLKPNFTSKEIEVEYGEPTGGGFYSTELEASVLNLNEQDRLQVSFETRDSSALSEAERGVVQEAVNVPGLATDPDPAPFRFLRGDTAEYEFGANWSRGLGEGGSDGRVALNAEITRSDSTSLSGLDLVTLTGTTGESIRRALSDDPLLRNSRTTGINTGVSYLTRKGIWDFDSTLSYGFSVSESANERPRDTSGLRADALAGRLSIDAALPAIPSRGFDTARTENRSLSFKNTLRGQPLDLPAGPLGVTLDGGVDWNAIDSESTRGLPTDLSRRNANGGIAITAPLVERDYGALGAIGDLAANASFGVDSLSDFGTLTDWTAGLTWSPVSSLSFTATRIEREAAPGLNALGAPIITSFNVPVFDFTNNETVLADVTTGGNPFLLEEKQEDWKLGVNWRFPFAQGGLTAEYNSTGSRNVTSSLPLLTPEIEAAFPGRVTRNAAGTLVAVDNRPVTFARTQGSNVRVGFNVSGPFGKARVQEPPAREGGGPPPGAAGRPGGQSEGQRPPGAGGPGAGGPGAGGPPSQEQMQRFMAFRERLCAEDGEAYFALVIKAAQGDEAAQQELGSDFDPEQAARFLERLKGPDGTIDMARAAQIRTGICSMDPAAMRGAGGSGGGGGSGARGGGRRGGGGGPFGGGDGRGRFFLSLFHQYEIESTVLIAPGIPELDLLDGDALSSGGTPRHSAQLEAGAFRNGLGLRLSGRYTGASSVLANEFGSGTDLFYDDIARFDIRAFADLGQIAGRDGKDPGFLKGVRVSLRMDNVFDAQQRITDRDGVVPLRFQPGLIDPVGRYVEVEFRKLF